MSETNISRISEAPSFEGHRAALLAERRKMFRNRRIGAGLLTATVLAGGGLLANQVAESLSAPSSEEKVETAVESNPQVLNAKVILSEGVNLRSEPLLKRDGAGGEQDNIVATVGDGEAVVLDHPVVYVNQVNDTYLGALNSEGEYVWVNETVLQDQQQGSDETYITYVVDQNRPAELTQGNFADGEFYLGTSHEVPVAIANSIPLTEIENVIPDYQ